jgi:DNA-binding response OmpR family regulator
MTAGSQHSLLLWALGARFPILLLADTRVGLLKWAILEAAAGGQFVDPRLRDRIREALGGVAPVKSSAAGVDLGPRTLQRKRAWNATTLTAKETALLSYLEARQGEAISVRELLENVWGCSLTSGGTLQQVASCVKRLRRKVEPDPHHPTFIRTARGLGYYAAGQETP